MYGTVVYLPEEQQPSELNPMDQALRSLSEATTEFVDWLSGSQDDNINDVPDLKDTSERSSMGSSTSSISTPRLWEGSTTSTSSLSCASQMDHDLSFTQDDVTSICSNDSASFYQLQMALRNKGCVTNTYLQQNLHHYVYHLKQFQAEENMRRRKLAQRQARARHQAKYVAPERQGPNQKSSIAA